MALKSLIIATGLLSFAACAFADPHYAVTISGALTSQVVTTGTIPLVHTVRITNSVILKQAMAASGGTITSTKDLDIVYDPDNTELDVIDITDPNNITVAYQILVTGTDWTLNGTVYSGNKNKQIGVSTTSDNELTLPGAQNTIICNATSIYGYNPSDISTPTSLTVTLTGNDESDFFVGVIKKAKKVYNY